MRNKYSAEFENYVKENASKYKKEELRKKLQKKYNIKISKNDITQYLYRHKIKCLDYKINKVRNVKKYPIGTEYVKDDGMILVKIGQPDKWEYKQRILYMKYHKCELTSDDYIIFLNQDRNDFSKENLKKISRKESAYLSNQQMFSTNPRLTETGILTAKLMIKLKDLKDSDKE